MDTAQYALEISYMTVFQPADVQLERVNQEVNASVIVKMMNFLILKVTVTHAELTKSYQEESVFALLDSLSIAVVSAL